MELGGVGYTWVLLQALRQAVNLSSEPPSYETLKIAEVLKKRMGEWASKTPGSMSNTKKSMLIHLFSLPCSYFLNTRLSFLL